MFTFALDYFIMVFVASLGVMQAAVSIGGLRGLLLFKNPIVVRPLGIAIAVAAIVWFFAVAERNINDYEGGLDSNQQGILFFLAVAMSGIITCALSSLWNRRMRHSASEAEQSPGAGLGALKSASWWRALSRNYRYLFNEETCWRTRIKRYFSG